MVTKEGLSVRNAALLRTGDRIGVLLAGGKADCEVLSIEKEEAGWQKQ